MPPTNKKIFHQRSGCMEERNSTKEAKRNSYIAVYEDTNVCSEKNFESVPESRSGQRPVSGLTFVSISERMATSTETNVKNSQVIPSIQIYLNYICCPLSVKCQYNVYLIVMF